MGSADALSVALVVGFSGLERVTIAEAPAVRPAILHATSTMTAIALFSRYAGLGTTGEEIHCSAQCDAHEQSPHRDSDFVKHTLGLVATTPRADVDDAVGPVGVLHRL